MNIQTQLLPAVAAAIFNDSGEVLLQRRRDTGKWCVISGHVEFGETVEGAMLREIREETGTDARLIRLIGIYSLPASQTYFYPGKTVQYITTYFEASLCGKIPSGFTNHETLELQFFHPSAIPDDMARINPDWLSDALNKESMTFIR